VKKIEWSPTFELGVPEIDDDHRLLFGLAQEICEAVEKADADLCHVRTDALLDALKKHFASEEEFLERAGYPNIDEHKDFHNSLLTKAEKLKQVCDDGSGRKMVDDCYTQTMTCLCDEIIRGDVLFVSHIKHHLLGR
jgi:hemerythrin-like metal-binding protein